MRVTNEVMPMLPKSLNQMKFSQGSIWALLAAKTILIPLLILHPLGYFHWPDHPVESENALRTNRDHRDFLDNHPPVHTQEILNPQQIYNIIQIKGFLVLFCSVAQPCPTLFDPMDCSLVSSSVHGDSPGQNTGVGCHTLFQGPFPAQGSNPCLPHCRWILYHLSHQGSFLVLEWEIK